MGVKRITERPSVLTTPLITYLREIVSVFLGIVLLMGTLILLWPCLSASPVNVQDAQGIFSILGGWGGVILGYYFGRMPAERTADRADMAARTAEMEKDIAEKKVEVSIADIEALERRLDSLIEVLTKTVG